MKSILEEVWQEQLLKDAANKMGQVEISTEDIDAFIDKVESVDAEMEKFYLAMETIEKIEQEGMCKRHFAALEAIDPGFLPETVTRNTCTVNESTVNQQASLEGFFGGFMEGVWSAISKIFEFIGNLLKGAWRALVSVFWGDDNTESKSSKASEASALAKEKGIEAAVLDALKKKLENEKVNFYMAALLLDFSSNDLRAGDETAIRESIQTLVNSDVKYAVALRMVESDAHDPKAMDKINLIEKELAGFYDKKYELKGSENLAEYAIKTFRFKKPAINLGATDYTGESTPPQWVQNIKAYRNILGQEMYKLTPNPKLGKGFNHYYGNGVDGLKTEAQQFSAWVKKSFPSKGFPPEWMDDFKNEIQKTRKRAKINSSNQPATRALKVLNVGSRLLSDITISITIASKVYTDVTKAHGKLLDLYTHAVDEVKKKDDAQQTA
jgi:hypothetical protein